MLQIDASLFVTFFVVWALVFVLSRVFWRPMLRTTAERDARLSEDREASRRGLEAYDKSLQDVAAALKAARLSADKVREDLEADALREKTRLLAEVAALSKDRVEKAKGQVRDEIVRLKTELAAEAEGLAGDIEKRLLG
jgi:F0F1-type ATP synthase membrane subunit b/b'